MIGQRFATNGSTSGPTRRDFLSRSVQAAGGVVLMIVAKGCTSKRHEIDLADAPELLAIGGVRHVRLNDVDFFLVRASETMVVTLENRCTHKRCDVEFDPIAEKFLCHCHGSQFDLSGRPVQGPAKRPLAQFPTSVTGTVIRVFH